MKRFVLFLSLFDDKGWGIYMAVEEKKYVALDDHAAICEDNWVLFDFPPPGPFDSVRKHRQGVFW